MSADLFGHVEAEPAKVTERDVLDALRRRYTHKAGNGERYILAEHVRDSGAFARRTADLMVRDVWGSSRMALHGFEVKVSRSDWLTELRDPTKAETFKRHCDYWWLAVSDASIVRDDLPADWGLIVMAGGTMRIRKQAPRQAFPTPMELDMRAALDRAIAKTARRHLILDIERGGRQLCERYVSPGNCLRVPNALPCWTCRAALLAQTIHPTEGA